MTVVVICSLFLWFRFYILFSFRTPFPPFSFCFHTILPPHVRSCICLGVAGSVAMEQQQQKTTAYVSLGRSVGVCHSKMDRLMPAWRRGIMRAFQSNIENSILELINSFYIPTDAPLLLRLPSVTQMMRWVPMNCRDNLSIKSSGTFENT